MQNIQYCTCVLYTVLYSYSINISQLFKKNTAILYDIRRASNNFDNLVLLSSPRSWNMIYLIIFKIIIKYCSFTVYTRDALVVNMAHKVQIK